jgi:hypothetical protein
VDFRRALPPFDKRRKVSQKAIELDKSVSSSCDIISGVCPAYSPGTCSRLLPVEVALVLAQQQAKQGENLQFTTPFNRDQSTPVWPSSWGVTFQRFISSLNRVESAKIGSVLLCVYMNSTILSLAGNSTVEIERQSDKNSYYFST